ncbi:DUF3606 domain-containing protein [Thalassotalea hakodatensis]|uniref:DUF3606 domain-containing protein n=1 Tax=Thalassotalea hakodatensis TaxID=3030492 RepID=UPI002573FAB5|nr:DUF3606 domain-containing protein [Thalassotalea hakodatensis]
MSDDLSRTGPEDPKKINISQDWEVRYWTKELGITVDELVEAVKAVGPMVDDVRAYVANMRRQRSSSPGMGM